MQEGNTQVITKKKKIENTILKCIQMPRDCHD